MSIAEKLTTMAENVPRVFDAGKKSQYDEFWDAYQENGNRTDYKYAFGMWTDDVFKPKYDIIHSTNAASYMFGYSRLTDVAQLLDDSGVVLDMSRCPNFASFAAFSKTITRFPDISTIGATSMNSIFRDNIALHTVDKLILKSDGSQTYDNYAFNNLPELVNIKIEGKFGQNLTFEKSSKLSHDSLMSILNALYDYSGTSTTRTLTLHADAKAKLSDSEKATATQKGWTIA